jgi:hypothetical protein
MKPLRQAASLAPPKPLPVVEPKVVEEKQEEVLEQIQEVVEENTTIDKPTQNRVLRFIKSMLSDSHDDNAISSKRVIAFLAFIFCSIGFFVDLFTDFQVTQTLYDSMMWIVIAGLGFTGLEKFAPKE